jgi:hypothetical protein
MTKQVVFATTPTTAVIIGMTESLKSHSSKMFIVIVGFVFKQRLTNEAVVMFLNVKKELLRIEFFFYYFCNRFDLIKSVILIFLLSSNIIYKYLINFFLI